MISQETMTWRDSPSVEQITEHLRYLLSFLEPLLPLANCHLVQFHVEDQWNNLVPHDLQEDLLQIPFKNLNLIPTAQLYDFPEDLNFEKEFPHLRHFLLTVRSFHLDKLDILTPIPELKREKLSMDKVINHSMNKKKAYEVSEISNFIGYICKGKNLQWMVDVGSGLGYLSSVLLLEYKYNILALDSSSSNIASSLEQCQRMQTLLNRFHKSQDKIPKEKEVRKNNSDELEISYSSEDTIATFKAFNSKLLLSVTKFIKTDDDLRNIILSRFKSTENLFNESGLANIGIVGLHTCGNLSPTSLRLYVANSSAKFLCNVGCCYHMLEEEFCTDYFYINKQRNNNNVDNRYHSEDMDPFHKKNGSTETGFPLSSYLKSIKFSLGRNARNLACKPSSTLSVDDKNLKPLFWRALLEVIVKDTHGFWPEGACVGRRIAKKCANFYEYCQKCFKNIELDIKLSEDEIYSYYEKYKCKEDSFARFSFLKVSLAPLIENLINMDRLLYLKEQGYTNSHLLPLFDNTISPRYTAVVSFKD